MLSLISTTASSVVASVAMFNAALPQDVPALSQLLVLSVVCRLVPRLFRHSHHQQP